RVPEQGHENEVHGLGEQQYGDGDAYGRTNVLLGIEPRRQDLDRQKAQEPYGIGHHRQSCLLHVGGTEGAVVEQGGNKAFGKQSHAQRRRQPQQDDQTQPPIEQGVVAVVVLARVRGGQAGQQNGAQGDAEQGGWKLHQPVGERQPGDTARGQPGGNVGVDEQRN